MTEIKIKIKMPDKISDAYRRQSLPEKVREYMHICESDENSYHHWNYLKAVYKKLIDASKIPAAYVDMMGELEEFMSKHSYYDSGDNQVDLEAKDMFKFRDSAG